MKSSRQNLYGAIIMCALVYPSAANAQSPGEVDVVRNGGFELGIVGWNLPEGMTRVETGLGHTGNACLRFENRDPGVYKLITQRIPVEPGDTLSFSAWIKGENLTSNNAGKGAGVFVESMDANGKWITGGYTAGFAGTYDWKRDGGTYGVPSNAASAIVGLYLRKESIGTAWFDDVEVRIQRKPEVQATLLYPNYRGMVTLQDQKPWRVQLSLPTNQPLTKVQHRLVNAQGNVLSERTAQPNPNTKTVIQMPPPANLVPGNYTWKLDAATKDGKTHTFSLPIQAVAKMPEKYIDAEGFTVVNGQRFFPFGVFLGSTTEEHLKRVSEGGFNTVLAYNNASPEESLLYLDSAQKYNLQVVFSVCNMYEGHHWAPKGVTDLNGLVENYVRHLSGKPALLSWYTNDEMGLEWLPKIQARYDLLTKQDPNHPVYQVLLDPGLGEKYNPTTDVLGTDPYPVGKGTDLQRTSGYTRVLFNSAQTTKGVWMVPQIFDWGVYPKENTTSHPPSLDEMRNQSYQALIHGAKGLIFYSYFDLWHEPKTRAVKPSEFQKRWPAVVAMSKEINGVLPAILHGRNVPLSLIGATKVELRAIEHNDELLLLAANPYYETQSIEMSIPAGWRVAAFNQGAIGGTATDGRLTLKLPAIGSGVFRLVKAK